MTNTSVASKSPEEWIYLFVKYQSGPHNIVALCNHYQGEGNTSRKLAEANYLHNNLHYKNERQFIFQTSLAKFQKSALFVVVKEKFTNNAKAQLLLDKIKHPELKATVNAIQVDQKVNGISFTRTADFFAGEVSRLPEVMANRRQTHCSTLPLVAVVVVVVEDMEAKTVKARSQTRRKAKKQQEQHNRHCVS